MRLTNSDHFHVMSQWSYDMLVSVCAKSWMQPAIKELAKWGGNPPRNSSILTFRWVKLFGYLPGKDMKVRNITKI